MSRQNETLKIKIDNCLTNYFSTLDSNAKINVILGGTGWIKIVIVSHVFEYLSNSERENVLDDALGNLGYTSHQFPILSNDLLTQNEAEDYKFETVEIPLWSDVLMLPDDVLAESSYREIETCPVFSFHSVGYGAHSTKTLAITANLLANEYEVNVVILDLNFNSPYFSMYVEEDSSCYGALDYIYERRLSPTNDFPSIESCVYPIKSNKGSISLIPCSNTLDEYYLHRLAEFDRGTICYFYKSGVNPIASLITDIKNHLEPDIILIDTPPGFSDLNSVVLLDLTDIAVPCFSPNNHSFKIMNIILKTVRKNQLYLKRPDLLFVVNSKGDMLGKTQEWLLNNTDVSDTFHTNNSEFLPPLLDGDIPVSISSKYSLFLLKVHELINIL